MSASRRIKNRADFIQTVAFIFGTLSFIIIMLSFGEAPWHSPKPKTVEATPAEVEAIRQLKSSTKNDNAKVAVCKQESLYYSAQGATFLKSVQKKLGKRDSYSFEIFELEDGEIFVKGEEMAFIPFEKINYNGNVVWLYLPVTHKDARDKGFSAMYEAYSYPATRDQRDEWKQKMYSYFEKDVFYEKNSMEGVLLLDWGKGDVTFVNVKFSWKFDEKTLISYEGETYYRNSKGSPVRNYLELPHNILVDQEKTGSKVSFTINR